MKQQQVIEVFKRYEQSLRCVFDYYNKLEDLELTGDVEINATLMSYRSFIKLTTQMKLSPALVTGDEAVMIYKLIMKDKSDSMKESLRALNYDDFLEALVRVAIRGNEKSTKDQMTTDKESSKDTAKASAMLLFDVRQITPAAIENLLKYMTLSPAEKKAPLIQRLRELQHESVKGATLKQKTTDISKGLFLLS
jgi:hypothetical protein